MKGQRPLEISFGAMGQTIARQINAQGLTYQVGKVKHFEEMRECILKLYFGKLITDAQKTKMQKKLFLKICSHVKSLNKTKKDGVH